MSNYTVFGIHLPNRTDKAMELQKVLTNFGCLIKTRIGLHPVDQNSCANNGLIILEILSNSPEIDKFEAAIKQLPGVEFQKMVF
jgi:hypothetical protein